MRRRHAANDARPAQPLRQHLPDRSENQLVPWLQTHAARDCGLANADSDGEARLAGAIEGEVRAPCRFSVQIRAGFVEDLPGWWFFRGLYSCKVQGSAPGSVADTPEKAIQDTILYTKYKNSQYGTLRSLGQGAPRG